MLSNWKAAGGPPLAVYAPYTAHCLLVDTFFHVAVGKKLISPDRLSNRVDIAYLYYLPFAMVFVSNDKLHKRVVPLLLRPDQAFIDGEELKRDLEALDVHYSGLPAERLEQGLFRFAEPPDDDRFLTTRLYRQFGFRVGDSITLTPGQNEKPCPRNQLSFPQCSLRLLARSKGPGAAGFLVWPEDRVCRAQPSSGWKRR